MTRTIEVNSWKSLVSVLEDLPPVDLACRGQAREYNHMRSGVDRCLDLAELKDRLRMERAICQRFREHAPIYLSDVEQRYLKTRWLQLVVMQHYGAPTRLLDWTKSPWVAAFFAVFGGCWEDSDGYIYGFRRDRLEDRVQTNYKAELPDLVCGPHPSDMRFSDEKWDLAEANDVLFSFDKIAGVSEWIATYYCREGHFPRLVAQQGLFRFAVKPDLDHWQQIIKLLDDKDCFVVVIDRTAKVDILRRLNGIGLNGATLFPGADGIGKSLEGFARAWHSGERPSQF
jgi:hypothetical protein